MQNILNFRPFRINITMCDFGIWYIELFDLVTNDFAWIKCTIHSRSAIICTQFYWSAVIIGFNKKLNRVYKILFYCFSAKLNRIFRRNYSKKNGLAYESICICVMNFPRISIYFHWIFGKNQCGFRRTETNVINLWGNNVQKRTYHVEKHQ